VRFGSWIGGDRDGKSIRDARCTRDALQMARRVILDHYLRAALELMDRLSSSQRQAHVSQELLDALDRYAQLLPAVARPGTTPRVRRDLTGNTSIMS